MSKTNMEETTIVVLFKNYEDLECDEREIAADFQREWDEANAAFDLVRKTILADETMLAKRDVPAYEPPPGLRHLKNPKSRAALDALDPGLCEKLDALVADAAATHAEHVRLKRTLDIEFAKRQAVQTMKAAHQAALGKHSERMFGFGKLAKRSVRFASAQASKNYGPAAS
jgi:hypothetical protein